LSALLILFYNEMEQYEFALARIEELLPMVDENTPANNRNAVELTMMSDVVIDYEKDCPFALCHFRNNASGNVGILNKRKPKEKYDYEHS